MITVLLWSILSNGTGVFSSRASVEEEEAPVVNGGAMVVRDDSVVDETSSPVVVIIVVISSFCFVCGARLEVVALSVMFVITLAVVAVTNVGGFLVVAIVLVDGDECECCTCCLDFTSPLPPLKECSCCPCGLTLGCCCLCCCC